MATYYARNVTGNWASASSWDTASSSGAGPAGPPVAGDTVIFDSGFTGTISVAAAAACKDLTVLAGATGTLNINVGFSLTLATGNSITLQSGFNISNSGAIALQGTCAIRGNGVAIPGNVPISSSPVINLTGDLTLSGSLSAASTNLTINGANLTIANFFYQASTLIIQSGRTLTVTNSMKLGSSLGATTLGAATAAAAAYLSYTGTAANCSVFRVIFTDIDAAESSQVIDNWNGGTLTRCTNINNVSSANLARSTDAEKILSGQTVGGVSGTATGGTGGAPLISGRLIR